MKEAVFRILRKWGNILGGIYSVISGDCSLEESSYWVNEGICERVAVPGLIMVGPSVLSHLNSKTYCLRR